MRLPNRTGNEGIFAGKLLISIIVFVVYHLNHVSVFESHWCLGWSRQSHWDRSEGSTLENLTSVRNHVEWL